jgi:primosomal protein N' (replication factor Y)
MSDAAVLFADVIVPVPVPRLFTYRVPADWRQAVSVGMRVVVQFGTRKVHTGIVRRLHHTPPEAYQAKYLLDLLENAPSVTEQQLRFWEWMADYYLCTLGEVMQAALPSGLKISTLSRIQLHPGFDWKEEGLEWTEQEALLLSALEERDALTYAEAAEVLQVKNIYQALKGLVAKRAIILFEEVREQYKPKRVRRIRLSPDRASSEEALEQVFALLEGKPKQEGVLLKYLSQVPLYANPSLNVRGVPKSDFLSDVGGSISASSLGTLVKQGIFEEFEEIVSRLQGLEEEAARLDQADIVLSPAQQEALDGIMEGFSRQQAVLLHGVTGSGKTELYLSLIQQAVDSGGQVLLLLPEIALTTQMVVRLKKAFGAKIGIYHSRFSDNERVEVWNGVASGAFPFVVGVRSSIFLPFKHLNLIIVDEEHEPSYRQHDPAPRYHARDAALVLAQQHQAKVLLGSATPAVESYYMALQGKYGLVSLLERFGQAALPEVRLVDTALERKQRKFRDPFSGALLEALRQRLQRGEQAILFQNRRGYSPYITCDDCAWTPECRQCAVSLTYHLYRNELRCHYCGYSEPAPKVCVACGSAKVKTMGLGTERIEDELRLQLPEARTQRMDLDTTRNKHSHEQLIDDFASGKVDVLVGTQMVAKGLDFDRVSLVGVFEADRLLHFPDFRAHERAFQLLVQVSGRAGRRGKPGEVLIQTADPRQALLQRVVRHDYIGMYHHEIQERERYAYPPFTRLIRLTVRCKERPVRDAAAQQLAQSLRRKLGDFRVLGPEPPGIDKVRNWFLSDILIKLERGKVPLPQAKQRIAESILQLITDKSFKGVEVIPQVDCL